MHKQLRKKVEKNALMLQENMSKMTVIAYVNMLIFIAKLHITFDRPS